MRGTRDFIPLCASRAKPPHSFASKLSPTWVAENTWGVPLDAFFCPPSWLSSCPASLASPICCCWREKHFKEQPVTHLAPFGGFRLLTRAVVPFTATARGHPALLSPRLEKSKRLQCPQSPFCAPIQQLKHLGAPRLCQELPRRSPAAGALFAGSQTQKKTPSKVG